MSHRFLSSLVIGSRLRCGCWPDGRPDTSGIEAETRKFRTLSSTSKAWKFVQFSPCRQLRWFYIKHHYSAHSGKRERRTCPVPCERWRRNFSHSSRCPRSSSSEREPRQLFGRRPVMDFFVNENRFLGWRRQWGRAEHSPRSVARQSSTARWRRWLTSNALGPPRRQSSRWHRWSCSCPRPVAPHCSRDTELEGFSLVLPSASGTIVLLRRREIHAWVTPNLHSCPSTRLTMSHPALSIFCRQICRSHGSFRWWVRAASIQLHRPLNHDFLANVPVGEKGERERKIVLVVSRMCWPLTALLTSKCWQWSAPPFHSETRDTCELASSDRGRRRRSHCTRMGKWLRLMVRRGLQGSKSSQSKHIKNWNASTAKVSGVERFFFPTPTKSYSPLSERIKEENKKILTSWRKKFSSSTVQCEKSQNHWRIPSRSPSIVTSNAPNANRVDRLCIQNSQIFRIDEFQSSFVQIQEQVFALEKKTKTETWTGWSGAKSRAVRTYVAPPTDHIEQVILAEGQVEDALIYSLRGALWREVLLGYLHPTERSHCKPYRLVCLRLQWVTAASERKRMRRWQICLGVWLYSSYLYSRSFRFLFSNSKSSAWLEVLRATAVFVLGVLVQLPFKPLPFDSEL